MKRNGETDPNQHQMRTDQDGETDLKREDQGHQISKKEGGQDPNHTIDQRAEDMMKGGKDMMKGGKDTDQGANQDPEKCSPVKSLI